MIQKEVAYAVVIYVKGRLKEYVGLFFPAQYYISYFTGEVWSNCIYNHADAEDAYRNSHQF